MELKSAKPIAVQHKGVSQTKGGDRAATRTRVTLQKVRRVAKNPNTDPELLRKFATVRDAIVRQNVAANPNTPIDILLELGADFPDKLVNNPIFSLLFLEDPNAIAYIPDTTLKSLLKLEDVPLHFLIWGANSSDTEVLYSLATHPNTPRMALDKLIQSRTNRVQKLASLHVNHSGNMDWGWDEAASHEITHIFRSQIQSNDIIYFAKIGAIDNLLLQSLCHNSTVSKTLFHCPIPQHILEERATDGDEWVRSAVAANPQTPKRILNQFAKQGSVLVLQNLATNIHAPKQILEKLATHDDERVRNEVARNPKTPAWLLEWLATHEDVWIRAGVAQNPKTPVAVLEQLATDDCVEIRSRIARNRKTPVAVLEWLATDYEARVCSGVARNIKTPVWLLELLAKNEDDRICRGVAGNPKSPASLLKWLASDRYFAVRIEVARNSNTTILLLEYLAIDRDRRVRSSVAKNPKTPGWLLENLALDSEGWVRSNVAKNPNTPATVLENLVIDDDCRVCSGVARNPKTPAWLLELLLTHPDFYQKPPWNPIYRIAATNYLKQNPRGLPLVLENLTHYSDNPLDRILALLHPKIPQSVLAENLHNPEWIERYAVAKNPSTPTEIVEILATDYNRVVRAAAKFRLGSQPMKLRHFMPQFSFLGAIWKSLTWKAYFQIFDTTD